jgi:hypothetical protein
MGAGVRGRQSETAPDKACQVVLESSVIAMGSLETIEVKCTESQSCRGLRWSEVAPGSNSVPMAIGWMAVIDLGLEDHGGACYCLGRAGQGRNTHTSVYTCESPCLACPVPPA